MKNRYIKFKEVLKNGKILNPNSPSFEEASKEAERLGYEEWGDVISLKLEGYGILQLDDAGTYFTSSIAEPYLQKQGYAEHIIKTDAEITSARLLEAARPLIKLMNELHPMHTAIVDGLSVVISESVVAVRTEEYLKD